MFMDAKSLQLCPTLCNLIDCSPPGFSVHGILQARVLEWFAIPFSRGSSRPGNQTCVSCISCLSPVLPGKPMEDYSLNVVLLALGQVKAQKFNCWMREDGERSWKEPVRSIKKEHRYACGGLWNVPGGASTSIPHIWLTVTQTLWRVSVCRVPSPHIGVCLVLEQSFHSLVTLLWLH